MTKKSDGLKTSNFQPAFGNLKFQVAFNLVVIWMIVFICLSKGGKTQICNDYVGHDFDDTDNVSGLRSYGKVVYVFGTLPIIGFVVFACKILALFPLVGCFDWLAIFIHMNSCVSVFISFLPPGLIPVLALQSGLVPLHLQQKCNQSRMSLF